ncbi:MAG TPA: PaeR7I family type II restriction endonuclease [Symbiobacteriaceae bacterium]
MALDLANFEEKAQSAIRAFWSTREEAKQKQLESGKQDQGERAGVTAGKNMDAFVQLAVDVIRGNGLTAAEIMLNKSVLTLPGFFRPTKQWDLLVVRERRLVAAIEFKSQVGPSFGNNANNRVEEALGTAVDLWTAYRDGAFGEVPRPFVGFFFVLEDAPEARVPVRDQSPHFPIFPEFVNASYADRYNILCKKLVQENLYTSAALLLTSRSGATSGAYTELSQLTGLRTFVTSLAGHIAAEAERG